MQVSNIPQSILTVFGASAPAGNVTVPFPTTPQVGGLASMPTGFTAVNFTPVGSGGIPPWGKDMNGILQLLTAWAQWLKAGGPITYDGTFQSAVTGYMNGSIVQSAVTPGLYWRSSVDNNTSNPDTGGAGWARWPFPIPIPIADGGTNNAGPFTTGAVIFADGTRLQQDATHLFYNNSAVRLGVGTNAPSATLDVRGTGIFTSAGVQANAAGNVFYAPNGGALVAGVIETTNTSANAFYAPNGGMILGGSAVIGNSLSVANSAAITGTLNVTGLGTFVNGISSLQNINITTNEINAGLGIIATNPVVELQNGGSGGNTWVIQHNNLADLTFAFNTLGRAFIDQFGNMTIQGTLTQASDIALKRDIVDLEPVLERVLALRPKRYRRHHSSRDELGLIAQDVREMFPELVEQDRDGHLGLSYQNLGGAVVLRALQELAAEVRRPWWRKLLGVR